MINFTTGSGCFGFYTGFYTGFYGLK